MSFVDLHNHLLWALDDGPVEAAETLTLARALVAAGFSDVAATPHAAQASAATQIARRAEAQAMIDREGIALKLHPGSENKLDPDFFDRIGKGDARPLGTGRYVLVEAPFQDPLPAVAELTYRLQLAGWMPVIAHPERCAEFIQHPERCEQLANAGCALQVEVGSFAGVYGKPAKKMATRLVDEGLAILAATDLHRATKGPAILEEGLAALTKHVGPRMVEKLLSENPRRILAGESL